LLENQGLVPTIQSILKLDNISKAPALVSRGQRTWQEWKSLTTGQERFYETVSIALVGKYTNLHDWYLSVIKSLEHSAMRCGKKLNLI
jgi:CTP synthase